MSSKDDRWGPKLHKVRPSKIKKNNNSKFYKKDNKIKQFISKIRQQQEDRRKGVKVRDVKYIKSSTGETVHAEYDIIPVVGQNGLYQIQEYILSEEDYHKTRYAMEFIADAEERKRFLESKDVRKMHTRSMYATIDYPVIQQLRLNKDLEKFEKAREEFQNLVSFQRIKNRILKGGDKTAKYIYEEGKTKNPRVYGYIGGIEHTIRGNRRIYDLRDKRVKEINKAVLNNLLTGEIKRKEYEEGETR